MNKLLSVVIALFFLSVSCSVYASSTIDLPVPANNVIAANSEAELNIDSLTKDVPYMVTCTLESTAPSQLDMSITPRLAPKGGFGVAKLNGKPMLKNIGSLQNGQNTLTFLASISADKTKPNVMVLKNLDNRFSAALKTCHAQPETNVTSAANRMGGGYFYLTNHLPYYLDVTIGNFFPTPYCIPPFTTAYIETSTGYQNIDVITTHI